MHSKHVRIKELIGAFWCIFKLLLFSIPPMLDEIPDALSLMPFISFHRAKALKERYKRQLRTYQKDEYGVPLPHTARKFSFFASPFKVAEVCTGLGVYLISLRAAVVLTIALGLLMIYPLVDNIETLNFQDSYYLYTQGQVRCDGCTYNNTRKLDSRMELGGKETG